MIFNFFLHIIYDSWHISNKLIPFLIDGTEEGNVKIHWLMHKARENYLIPLLSLQY